MAGVRHVLTVSLVAVLAGLLFTASAQLSKDTSGVRQPAGLADLVVAAQGRVDGLTSRASQLRAEVDSLASAAPAAPVEDPALVLRDAIAAGTVAVAGAGLTVALDDAPTSSLTIAGVTPDDLVIHQQDVQDVINALWAGGAEAMTLQGERVTMTTAFRCSGNILLLHGKVFSPPYEVAAIGNPVALRTALDESAGVRLYREWVDAVGLGWSVSESSDLRMPAYAGPAGLTHASLPAGTDPLR